MFHRELVHFQGQMREVSELELVVVCGICVCCDGWRKLLTCIAVSFNE